MIKVIKRDSEVVEFDKGKIVSAIEKAMKYGSGVHNKKIAVTIAEEVELVALQLNDVTVSQIENMVYNKLILHGDKATAKAYEGYRAIQEYKRQVNTTDIDVLGLIDSINEEVMTENSNKDAKLVSTQRDLIAGEVSKDMVKRKLYPPHITQAHEDGAIHLHDRDYLLQKMFNCCIPDLKDMLDNGTVINGKMIETPKSFQTACTITTQILAGVASSQWGGTSINGIDRILAPYVRKSFKKYLKEVELEQTEHYDGVNNIIANEIAWERTKKEISNGIQTIQYQINTLNSSNGQSPFVTLLMYFEPDSEYANESALITEEILKQRIQGVKNEVGVYITPSFPKLIYVLDEHNIHKDSEYYYLTELSAKCTAKRMYPDYISAKKMKEIYDGNVFVPMGKQLVA